MFRFGSANFPTIWPPYRQLLKLGDIGRGQRMQRNHREGVLWERPLEMWWLRLVVDEYPDSGGPGQPGCGQWGVCRFPCQWRTQVSKLQVRHRSVFALVSYLFNGSTRFDRLDFCPAGFNICDGILRCELHVPTANHYIYDHITVRESVKSVKDTV